jgi:hypothetical protein
MLKRDTEYRLENVREALLNPGGFYYDSTDGTVTVILDQPLTPDGEHPVATSLGCLVRLDNARFLNLRNLIFRHGGGYRPALSRHYDIGGREVPNYPLGKRIDAESPFPYGTAAQAAVHVPGTIFLANTTDCEITGCTVTATGWYGIEAGPGCSRLLIDRNELCELGAGGIRIGGSPANGPAELRTSRIIVTNNHIHDGGLVHPSGIGVLITHAFGNLVEHNHIHDLRYSGVSAGWCWGYGETVTRENRIGWNYIHDLGKEVVSDMGGVYLLGAQPGTVVSGNVIHDVRSKTYGGWALYTDEGSSFITLENNVCYDCSDNLYHQHYGSMNVVRNNVFAFAGEALLRVSRPERHMCILFERNILLSDGCPVFRLSREQIEERLVSSGRNLLWNVCGAPVYCRFGEGEALDLAAAQAAGAEHGSVIADPRFADAAHRDFRLMPDSPALKMGFVPIDIADVGPRGARVPG